MGRIAVTEDVEGHRDEEEFGEAPTEPQPNDSANGEPPREPSGSPPPVRDTNGKCIATVIEVQDAFDSLNTLRYSQPTHLQGNDALHLQRRRNNLLVFRKVPGIDNHSIQRWAHSGRRNMEDSLPFIWYNCLCSQHEPHARTSPGRHRSHSPGCWRNIRTFSKTRPSYYRCRTFPGYYKSKEGP